MRTEKTKRNERIFEAVISGSTWSAAAAAEGITTERARQVVHKMRRKMMHPKRLGTDMVPDSNYWEVKELREHANFWLAQLAKWREEHGSNADVTGLVS